VKYANLPNHSNIGMIWKYYPSLIYFGLEKLLRLYCIVFYDFLDIYVYIYLNIGWKIPEFMKQFPIQVICWYENLLENCWGWP